jgi:hypothetical protein
MALCKLFYDLWDVITCEFCTGYLFLEICVSGLAGYLDDGDCQMWETVHMEGKIQSDVWGKRESPDVSIMKIIKRSSAAINKWLSFNKVWQHGPFYIHQIWGIEWQYAQRKWMFLTFSFNLWWQGMTTLHLGPLVRNQRVSSLPSLLGLQSLRSLLLICYCAISMAKHTEPSTNREIYLYLQKNED